MNIIEKVKKEVLNKSNEYKLKAPDNYDFWNEHVKYVCEESLYLAEKYNANKEIVELGALLHDIALIEKVGDRKDHHINGMKLAKEILSANNYNVYKIQKVLGCVHNHRSSKNATNIEELCVADADILAHFDNIPMLFNSAYKRCNVELKDVREWMLKTFETDYDDLSDKTKETFKEKYELLKKLIIGI